MHALAELKNNSLMAKQPLHPSAIVAGQVIDSLLGQIAREHYKGSRDKCYHAHRAQLTHAICWPATWFKQRAIHLSDARYKEIIQQRLREIRIHGCVRKAQAYFPRYLLKCLQNHFLYRGDHIYEQYKQVGYTIELLMQKLPELQKGKTDREMIDVLAQAYCITKAKRKTKPVCHSHQLRLDLET